MTDMTQVAATEFARNFSLYREAAQREPIAVVAHKRIAGYFVSAHDFEDYRRYKEMQPAALLPEELSEQDLQALRDVRPPASAVELNYLME